MSNSRLISRIPGMTDGKVGTFSTVADVEDSHISAVLESIRTNGYHEPGDGGGAQFRRKTAPANVLPGDRTSADGSKLEIADNEVSILQLGAVADGNGVGGGTPIDGSFQDAIDLMAARGGGVVKIPRSGTGIYRVDGEITGRANVSIVLDADACLDFSNRSSGGASIRWQGSVDGEIDLGAYATRGDTTITTATPHGLSVGDWFLIKSQRLAQHEDAGGWRLGEPTGSQFGCYFAEPCQVKEVVSSTQVELSSPLIFPDYRTDDSQETSPNARPSTTIQKINWLENASIRGGRIISGGTNVLRFDWCYMPRAFDIRVDMGDHPGEVLRFEHTFAGHHRGVSVDRLPGFADGNSYNAFKDVGSWWCTHQDWLDVNGWQSLDVSWINGDIPSIEPKIINGTSVGSRESLTFHPGAFGGQVKGIRSINCNTAINIRAPWVDVEGCRAIGFPGGNHTGILLGPWARFSRARGNYIFGFQRGIQAETIGIQGPGLSLRRRLIENNDILQCKDGVYIGSVVEDSPRRQDCEDAVIGNRIIDCYNRGVRLRPYVNGARVWDNLISGPLTEGSQAGILEEANCIRNSFKRNVFRNLGVGSNGIRSVGITNRTYFPLVDYPSNLLELDGNRFEGEMGSHYAIADTLSSPNLSVGPLGRVKVSDTLSSNATAVFENNSSASVVAFLTASGGTSLIYLGQEDNPGNGGLQVNAGGVLGFRAGSSTLVQLHPNLDTLRPVTDNTLSLGGGSNRWSEVFSATGSINTSDAREKTPLRAPTEAERNVAVRLSKLPGVYQWLDAISVKGEDGARLHMGVTAQDVKEAFEAEGLDGFRYGVLCYDAWGDEPPEYDSDGNLLSTGVVAGNRYGIRYDELAQWQAAGWDARLQALEAAT